MLEKMGEFFDNRLDGYEEHQLKFWAIGQLHILSKRISKVRASGVLTIGAGSIGLQKESKNG